MAEEVKRLEVEISGDTSPLQRALISASRSVEQFSNRTSQVTRENGGMADSMSRAGDAVESLSDKMKRWQAGLNNNGSLMGKFTERLGKIKDAAEDVGSSMVSLGIKSSKYIAIIGGVGATLTPVAGVIGAIGASAVSATAGLAGFGAVAFSTLKTMYEDQEKINKLKEKMDTETDPKKIKELQEQIKGIYETMSKEQRKAMEDMNEFSGFWGKFTSQFDKPVFQSFSNALKIAEKGLNLLKPAIDGTAQTVVKLTEKFENSLGSDRIKSLFTWFGDTAGRSLMAFGKSIGYTLEGVLQFFKAFNPLMADTEGGLVKMTKSFADWSAGLSKNNGFQAFLNYTKQNAPLLGNIFKNLMGIMGDGIKLIAVVAAPAVSWILKMLGKFLEWRNSIKVSQILISNFKDKVIEGFQKLKVFVQPAIAAVSQFVGQKIKEIKKFWDSDGAQFVQAVQNAFKIIGAVVKFVMPAVLAIIKSVWGNIKGIINGALKVIMGTIRVFSGLLTRDFKKAWQGVVGIFKGQIQIAWNLVQVLFIGRILKGIGGFIKAFGASLKGGWTSALNNMKGFVNGGTKWFKEFYTKGKKWFDDLVDAAKNLPKRLGDGMAAMKNKASDGIKKLANHMVGMLATGVNGAINGVNWVLEKIGVDKKSRLDTWTPPKYKNGTEGHPEDGFAVVGDGKKEELMQDPSGRYYMSPATDTLVWMKKGTRVWSGENTEKIMQSATKYDSGNSTVRDFFKSAGKKIANTAGAAKDAVVDKAVSVKNKAVSGAKAMGEKVSDIWEYASDPSKLMKIAYEKFIPKLPSVGGAFGDIGKALVGKAKDNFIDYISEKMSEFMPDFGGGGSGIAGYYLGSPFRVTTRFTPNGNKSDKVHKGGVHRGLDLAAPAGTIIKSLTDGIVKEVLVNNATGGNLARIASGDYLLSYAHMLKAPSVKVGQKVKEGQRIGLVGSTGFSTGNHLDLKIKKNDKYIDPLKYLQNAGGGAPSGKGVERWRSVIYKAAAQMKEKVSATDVNNILKQINRESSGNEKITQSASVRDVNTRNGNPARGLLQYIPQTFRSYAVKGYGDIYNGFHQLLAWFNNTKWRQNNPAGRSGWGPTGKRKFEKGGFINYEQEVIAGEKGKQEVIIPLEQHRPRAINLWTQAGKKLGALPTGNISAPKNIRNSTPPTNINTVNNTNNYNIAINAEKGVDEKAIAKQVIIQLENKDRRKVRSEGFVM